MNGVDIENTEVVETIIEDYIYTVNAWPRYPLDHTKRDAHRAILLCMRRFDAGLPITPFMEESATKASKFIDDSGDF